jgi:hypothetical protein
VSRKRRDANTREWLARPGFTAAISLSVLALALLASIGAMFLFVNGPLMFILAALWALGAGAAGRRWRSWRWPILCPLAMVALVMLWQVSFGRTSWASTFVFMIGAVYAVAAACGAIVGTWLGKQGHHPG